MFTHPKLYIMKRFFDALTILVTVSVLHSCSNGESKAGDTDKKADTPAAKKADTPVAKTEPASKPAIINIIDTLTPKRMVLCIKDSAASFERVGPKLGLIYGVKLAELIKKEKLKATGAPMAWYHSDKPPFFFEAGIPVAAKPAKLPAGVFIRETTADSATIAHFFGPYNLLSQGYEAVRDWIKSRNKISTAAPFEIYVGDPMDKNGKPADPYKVQTDIIFPVKSK